MHHQLSSLLDSKTSYLHPVLPPLNEYRPRIIISIIIQPMFSDDDNIGCRDCLATNQYSLYMTSLIIRMKSKHFDKDSIFLISRQTHDLIMINDNGHFSYMNHLLGRNFIFINLLIFIHIEF